MSDSEEQANLVRFTMSMTYSIHKGVELRSPRASLALAPFFFFLSDGEKTKAGSAFSHIAFYLLHCGFEEKPYIRGLNYVHPVLRLRSHRFSFFSLMEKKQKQGLLFPIVLFICCTADLKCDQQRLLFPIVLFICCTASLMAQQSSRTSPIYNKCKSAQTAFLYRQECRCSSQTLCLINK